MEVTKEQLQTALEKSWARETSSTPEEWSKVNSSTWKERRRGMKYSYEDISHSMSFITVKQRNEFSN